MKRRTLAVVVGILLCSNGVALADEQPAPIVYDERLPMSLPMSLPMKPTMDPPPPPSFDQRQSEGRRNRQALVCPFVIQTFYLKTLAQTSTWPPPQPYYYEATAQELSFGDEIMAHTRAAAIIANGLKIRVQNNPVATFVPPHLVTMVQTAPANCEAELVPDQEKYLERAR